MSDPPDPAQRSVLSLAVPALVVLTAEPLYLLVDTAVVGRLGAVALAALAVGGGVLALASVQFNFLAYGTTARAARRYGRGERDAAVVEGVQASWLAAGLGVALVVAVELVAGPLTRVLAGGPGPTQAAAELWLRIAVAGVPFLLLGLAGNGWLRGIQDTRRPLRYAVGPNVLSAVLCPILVHPLGWGLPGSAVANVVAQVAGGVLFLRALHRAGVSLRPERDVLAAQLQIGRDLALRTVVLQLCFLLATAVAARLGTAQLAAHQIALRLFFLLALVLDSIAIAAQALVGQSLGAGRVAEARRTAWRITRYGALAGVGAGVLLLAGVGLAPALFTDDAAVLTQLHRAWWWVVAVAPLAGVVFALDGVLMGAGDVAYLRTLTLAASLVGFLPLLVLTLPAGLGIGGIWAGLLVMIGLRLIGTTARVRSGRWAEDPAATPRRRQRIPR